MIAQSEKTCLDIETSLVKAGLFSDSGNTWRISPEPYFLSQEETTFFHELGPKLLKFYSALNRFYLDSTKGKFHPWIAEYLDGGKPQELLEFGRMKRMRQALPGIIRPDVIVTENGFALTELDSVPGGFGLTSALMSFYDNPSWEMTGGGIPSLFYKMAESVSKETSPNVAIVVSDESKDYLSEMQYLGSILKQKGVYVVHPKEISFKEEGLFIKYEDKWIRVDVLYRFFELFDLKNIPKSELFLYSTKKGQVVTTPPYKPWMEEKLSFALFSHPSLKLDWEKVLGSETFTVLNHLIPETWILDPRPLPPHGVIADLKVKGIPLSNWAQLLPLTQKEREMVIKPSGFSPESWGSRGVVVGHDVSQEIWQETLIKGLQQFPEQSSILQKFYKGKKVESRFLNSATGKIEKMISRVRLTPYYFVVDEMTKLGGILATLCPHDKKKIHGMVDAIIAPCATKNL
tara:strand:+ start:156 stop:1535 length:1380 start_codon:yes stop_codon:yes gene_type:complete